MCGFNSITTVSSLSSSHPWNPHCGLCCYYDTLHSYCCRVWGVKYNSDSAGLGGSVWLPLVLLSQCVFFPMSFDGLSLIFYLFFLQSPYFFSLSLHPSWGDCVFFLVMVTVILHSSDAAHFIMLHDRALQLHHVGFMWICWRAFTRKIFTLAKFTLKCFLSKPFLTIIFSYKPKPSSLSLKDNFCCSRLAASYNWKVWKRFTVAKSHLRAREWLRNLFIYLSV